jgi:hypothetical protein
MRPVDVRGCPFHRLGESIIALRGTEIANSSSGERPRFGAQRL